MDIDNSLLTRELNKFIEIKHLSTHIWAKVVLYYDPPTQMGRPRTRYRYSFYHYFNAFEKIKEISNQIYEDMWATNVVERFRYLEETFESIKAFIDEQFKTSVNACGLPIPSEMERINKIVSEIHRDNIFRIIDEIVEILLPINQEFINHIRQLQERDINNNNSSASLDFLEKT